jgi:hypothetical protein
MNASQGSIVFRKANILSPNIVSEVRAGSSRCLLSQKPRILNDTFLACLLD